MKSSFIHDFLDFVREQGVMGLAVAFVLGAAVKDVVSSLVEDLINPLLGLFLGQSATLEDAVIELGSTQIRWGSFAATIIDFLIIAIAVYFFVKILNVDDLDKKKS